MHAPFKKLIAAILVASMIFTLVPNLALADNAPGGFEYMENIENNGEVTITITGYVGPGGAVKIPSTIEGAKVTEIGNHAFEDCKVMTSVSIPSTVVSIGMWAFLGCDELHCVVIPSGVVKIGDMAFFGCENLTNVSLSDTVTSIGEQAFDCNYYLSAITVAKSNSYFSSRGGVLYNKSGTELVSCPEALDGKFVVPNGVIKIHSFAFFDCNEFSSITLPSSLQKIGQEAFENCDSLKSINLPSSVNSIGYEAFRYCFHLTAINVSASNRNLFSKAGVLYSSAQKKLIVCPEGKSGTVSVPQGITSIDDHAFDACDKVKNITLPVSLTKIGAFSFYDSGIRSIFLSRNVSSIGVHSLDTMQTIRVDASSPYFSAQANVLYSKNKTVLYFVPRSAKGKFAIPSSVITVFDSAFCACQKLTGISLPANLQKIGANAFIGCSKLMSITLPNKLQSIGDNAFEFCKGVTSITLPASVTNIGQYAFAAMGMTKAVFKGSMPAIGNAAFVGNAKSFKVYYPISQTSSWSGYADYPKQAYCIATLNLQDGSAATQVMTNVTNGHIAAPVTPKRTGYTFSGWYKDATCTSAWDFDNDMITGDITLYAKWTAA